MPQIQPIQIPQAYAQAPQPNYNAVKIDIHNPQVNAPNAQNYTPAPEVAPVYNNIPAASVYEVPKQSIYEPKPAVTTPKAVKEMPPVPAPVIMTPTVTTAPPVEIKPENIPVPPITPTIAPAPTQVQTPAVAPAVPTEAKPQTVEIKAPEQVQPKVDINEFITKLTSTDFEQQANTMESIADMAQNQPQLATEFLDVKVIDTLLGIMQSDSSKLEGPTAQQLQIREKIMSGKPVTEAETAEANKITPMEQSERNKQYAIYTVAILQKLYGSEIEKMSSNVVPMTELPGAAGIVEQIKNNPNPMVRASGIDALSYIQRPEYKQDLTTLFTIAQKDKDVNVQQAATKALEKLKQVPDAKPAQATTTTEAKPEATKV